MAKTTTSARPARAEHGWIETFLRPSDPKAMARRSELVGVIVVGLAAAFGAALWTYNPADMDVVHAGRGGSDAIHNLIGPVGARIADILLHLFGIFAYALNGLLMMVGLRTVMGRSVLPRLGTFNGVLGGVVAAMLVVQLWSRAVDWRPHDKDAAGLFGSAVTEFLRAFLSGTGTLIVALVLLATAVSALAGRPIIRDVVVRVAERLGWLKRRALSASENATEQLGDWKQRRADRREIEESAKFEAVPAPIPDIFAEELARADARAPLPSADGQREHTTERFAPEASRLHDVALRTDELRTDELRTDELRPEAQRPDVARPEVVRSLPRIAGSKSLIPQVDALDTDTMRDAPLSMPNTRVSRPNARRASATNVPATRTPEGFPVGTQLRPKELQVPTGIRRARAVASRSDHEAAEVDEPLHTPVQPRAELGEPAFSIDPQVAIEPAQDVRVQSAPIDNAENTPLGISAIEPQTRAAERDADRNTDDDARPALLGNVPDEAARGFGPRIVETEAMRGIIRSSASDDVEQGKLAIGTKKAWKMPRKSLLQEPPPREIELDEDLLARNAMTLLEKLHDFKVDGSIEKIRPGPVVTTYEFKPAKGIRVNKITGLRDDLTMSLSAENVRVVAPIPGKDVVGIEVPNEQRQIVYFREVIDSAVWQRSRSPLTIVLGKDIEGGPVVADLAKAPHLLVAGATGQGKSVGVNSMICSMLYKASPDDVKFIFIDPKVIELSVYEGIPHLLLPVLSDPDKATLALKWAVREMERRYSILHDAKVRNLDGYKAKLPKLKLQAKTKKVRVRNGKKELVDMFAKGADILDHPPEPENLPKLVIVIDEFADLILNTGKEVEVAVSRLAAKARACGIHIILATQRPDTKVITGTIKANFPSRVAFKVSTKVDSGVVLDQSGAETLLGMGDMLFWPAGKDLIRCHGTFVTDEEVIAIADHWKEQGEPIYDLDILKDPEAEDIEVVPDEELDTVFWDAVQVAIDAQQASVSFLQRKLKIGYQRSARIIDQMEARGIVGTSTGANRPREILDYNPAIPSNLKRFDPEAPVPIGA